MLNILLVGSGYTGKLYSSLFDTFGIQYSIASTTDLSAPIRTYSMLNQQYSHAFVCTPVNSHIKVVRWLLSQDPKLVIYCEKPFCFDTNFALDFPSDRIFILTNRRYYSHLPLFSLRLKQSLVSHLSIVSPETISKRHTSLSECILGNTIHLFDLLVYLFGEPTSFNLLSSSDCMASYHLQFAECHSCSFSVILGSFINTSFQAFLHSGEVLSMSPIEYLAVNTSLQRLEPTSEFPFRRYLPNTIALSNSFSQPSQKPGFYELVSDLYDNGHATRLPSLTSHLKLIQSIPLPSSS